MYLQPAPLKDVMETFHVFTVCPPKGSRGDVSCIYSLPPKGYLSASSHFTFSSKMTITSNSEFMFNSRLLLLPTR